jgi:hypothetical protein
MYIKRRKIKVITASLKSGNTRYNACKAAGITTVTLWFWCKKKPRLQRLIDTIVDDRVKLVEDALYQNAIGGNPTAQIFFLCNRNSDRWKRDAVFNQTLITKVEQNNNSPVKKMSNEELDHVIGRVKAGR